MTRIQAIVSIVRECIDVEELVLTFVAAVIFVGLLVVYALSIC